MRLREQVDLYTKKYDEFQSALSRSNEVFGGFKEEMDRVIDFLEFSALLTVEDHVLHNFVSFRCLRKL